MSLSVICGQLLVVGLEGRTLLESERRLFADGLRGGVTLFRRNVSLDLADVAAMNASLAAAAPPELPPLIAVDQEGGRVMRLGPPALQLPPMRKLGAHDDALIMRVAEAQARELAALGFTMSFAPVADVHTRDENPIIGDRAFATTPEGVARAAGAFAAGLAKGGVLSCAKHFPGHGDTTVDSHLALPRVERDLAGLERLEIAPFAALAKRPELSAMMTAHVVYPALAGEAPATLSDAVCTDLLRKKLGFSGVLFSDDLEMKALSMPVSESAVRAVSAGCDVLLICSRADLAVEAHEALVHEAEKSEAFRARVNEAAERALAMRRRVPPRPVTELAALARVFAASTPVARALEAL